jgi:LuxR family maltose regulon positive regulatory protein
LLAAGDPDAAFRLLTERVVADFGTNPNLGSALDDVQPDVFADAPEILVPLAAELLLQGAFEPGARAFHLAQQATGRAGQPEPEMAVRLSLVSAMYRYVVGELSEALQLLERIPRVAAPAVNLEAWLVGDVVALYSHAFLGQFDQARRVAHNIASEDATPPSAREVLCPGIVSQVALAEGDLSEAGELAARSLHAAHGLGFDRHYFAFTALRTAALLALERRDFAAAGALTERSLDLVSGGRPLFEYLAQLDRARLWAAAGNPDEALASLPGARAALRSDRSVLLPLADELDARLRLRLGDRRGALSLVDRLSPERRIVVSAMIALESGDFSQAEELLGKIPASMTTIRDGLERQLLQANLALVRSPARAVGLVRAVLTVTNQYGFVQTALDTAPLLVEHLVSESDRYPPTDNLAALITAGLQARDRNATRPGPSRLPDPLTDAELRVLQGLPQRQSYADIASDLHLSLNTVKTHLRHIYMKLGVSSRSAAVRRAISLGFL